MTGKLAAQEIKREAMCNFALKRSVTKSFAVFVFLSLTVLYTLRGPTSKGIHYNRNNTTTFQVTSSDHQLLVTSKRNIEAIRDPKRVNIIIMSFPRSGSSFLGDVFNRHPGVFYLFEPLRAVQRSFSEDSLFEFDFSSPSYQNRTFDFLKDIMKCNFSSDVFIRYLTPQGRKKCRTLTSPPFCVKNITSAMVCHQLKSQDLETVCKRKYNVFAAKILTPRMPTVSHDVWSKNLLQSCSSNVANKCKIIHLVRDPRAVVNSLESLSFFRRSKDPRRELSWFVKNICHQMEFDMMAGSLIKTSSPDEYRLVRFEDLARDPLTAVSELYKFTGIEMLDAVKKWLHETTKSKNGQNSAYSTSRDSNKVVSNWRTKMSAASVMIVEKYCGKVIKQLNYTLTGLLPKRRLNLNVSLID